MAKISNLPLLDPATIDGSESVPLVKNGVTLQAELDTIPAPEAKRQADRADAARLATELVRDQAADLVLPANIFVDVAQADAEAALAEGTYYKLVNTSVGFATVFRRDAVSSTRLYDEITKAGLESDEGASRIGFKQSGGGAIARTLDDKARETISVTDFGAVGDGIANNDAALAAAHAYMAARSAAGGSNTMELVWPAGRYIYTSSENWGIDRLRMRFEGEVWLIRTGTGPAFILDGGASGAGLLGLQILGYPYVTDDGTPHHAIYARAIHSSRMEIRSTGAGAGFSAFYGEWLVDNDISFVVSGIEGGIYKVPDYGLHLTNRNVNEECSYNRIQVRVSGEGINKIPVGVYLDGALGNKITGTIQNCTLGFKDTTNAWQNVFDKVDWEANSADAEIHGEQTQLAFCDFQIGPVFKSDALDCSMIGGSTVNVTLENGAFNTLLSSFTYNRRRIPGTGVITPGWDQSTRFRDLKNGKTGAIHDAPPSRTVVAVGPSPYTYTNTSGNNESLIVSGGTLSVLGLGRGDLTDAISVSGGQVVLAPGDRLYMEYSFPPGLIRWT
jgi:hypothetical protein